MEVFSSILLPSILMLTMVLSCCYLFFLRSYKIPIHLSHLDLFINWYTFESICWGLRYIWEYFTHLTPNNCLFTVFVIFLWFSSSVVAIFVCIIVCFSNLDDISFDIRINKLFIGEYLFQISFLVIIKLIITLTWIR